MYTEHPKPEVLVTMSITQSQIDRLEKTCHVVKAGWGQNGVRLCEDELCEKMIDTDILLVGYEKITEKVVQSAKKLKLIGVSRANPVNIDLDSVNSRKIPIIFSPGRNSIAAAEYTLGLMINQARNITLGDKCLRSGKFLGECQDILLAENPCNDVIWNLDGDTPYIQLRGSELAGKTLGLIGFGNVAARVAHLAKAFDMRVVTFTPKRDKKRVKQEGISIVSLEQLLADSDYISLHCSVNDETKSILDRQAFSQMKKTVYLINTARASLIDQEALISALENNKIGGAALDVFWYEPLPGNHPLLRMDNVTLTPHLAGSTYEVPERHSRMIVDDVFAWLENKKPRNLYNRDAIDR